MNIVYLPKNLNEITISNVFSKVKKYFDSDPNEKIIIDFHALRWIEPFGIAALSSMIVFYRDSNAKFTFSGFSNPTEANKYLHDAEFFKFIFGRDVDVGFSSSLRVTTIPYRIFYNNDYIQYLYKDLAPWIGLQVNLCRDTLETIRACLEEIFHNVEYHSGRGIGFTISQHFPAKKIIKVAISDSGIGIPGRVSTKIPDLNDAQAIKKACEEGFTTQTNVKNRGVGLALLNKYVAGRNGGRVRIISGNGSLEAFKINDKVIQKTALLNYKYPGTIVSIEIRTDTLEVLDEDVQKEIFEW